MALPVRPLGLLTEVVQLLGLNVTGEHDDLVFVSDNLFILQFTDQNHCIDLYFNEGIEEEKAQTLMALMEATAEAKGLQVGYKGAFCKRSREDGQIELEFFNLTDGL